MVPILSIITPIYNSFSLLRRSLDIFSNWENNLIEWVIVDDCSTDDTYQLLSEFKVRNPKLNISIFSCETNSGPGVARNIGVRMARGQYIAFLDSDDFFDDSFWSIVLPEIRKNRDCIIFDAYIYYDDGRKIDWPIFRNGQAEGSVSTKDAIVYLLGAPWGKIYKKNIIIENNVIFLSQKSNEDVPFTKHAVSCCEDIVYLKKNLYYYVQHENSLIRDETLFNVQNTLNTFTYIKKNIGVRYPLEVEALFASSYLYSHALLLYKSLPKKDYLQSLYEAEKMFPKYFSNLYLKNMTIQQKLVIACVRYKFYTGIKILLWIKEKRNKCLYRT